jgi:hypothetical protein
MPYKSFIVAIRSKVGKIFAFYVPHKFEKRINVSNTKET